MEITILGSGRNSQIPMPTCECRICEEAREKGIPYERSGNSIFIHDENILVDCPETTWKTLDREKIKEVDTILLTHYHGDHILGLRILQALGGEQPPVETFIGDNLPKIIINKSTYEKCVRAYGFFEQLVENMAELKVIEDNEEIELGNIKLKNIESEMSETGVKGKISHFLLEEDNKKILISSDENKFLDLSRVPELDLWIKETGYFMEDPDGNLLVAESAPETTLSDEMKFSESIEQIKEVNPERTVLTEIEELFRHSHDDLKEIEKKYSELNIEFAYDGMNLEA